MTVDKYRDDCSLISRAVTGTFDPQIGHTVASKRSTIVQGVSSVLVNDIIYKYHSDPNYYRSP